MTLLASLGAFLAAAGTPAGLSTLLVFALQAPLDAIPKLLAVGISLLMILLPMFKPLPPMALIFVILFAASQSVTPVGYQTNLMVFGSCRYPFLDMTRYGAPLTVGLALVVPWLICRRFGL